MSYMGHLVKNWRVSKNGLVEMFKEGLKGNWKIANKYLILSILHFVHGLIPVELTSHETWGIHL